MQTDGEDVTATACFGLDSVKCSRDIIRLFWYILTDPAALLPDGPAI